MADNYNDELIQEEEQDFTNDDEMLEDEDMVTGVKGGATGRSGGDLDEMDPSPDENLDADYNDYASEE